MIRYVSFTLDVHELAFSSLEELEAFKEKIKQAVMDIHPQGKDIFDSSVEVSIDETAGSIE